MNKITPEPSQYDLWLKKVESRNETRWFFPKDSDNNEPLFQSTLFLAYRYANVPQRLLLVKSFPDLFGVKKITFESKLFLERSITSVMEELGDSKCTMELCENKNGELYIVWNYTIDGDEDETVIGIESEGHQILGYDGVMSIPDEAIHLLQLNGYNTEEIE